MSSTFDQYTRRWVLGVGLAGFATSVRAKPSSLNDIVQLVRSLSPVATLRILIPEGSDANLAPLAVKFEDLTGIALQWEAVPVDEVALRMSLDRLTDAAAYDLALPPTFAIPDLAENGAIRDLSQIEGYDDIQNMLTPSLYTVGDTFDGTTYGFQTDGDAYLTFYNTDFWNERNQKAYEDQYGSALTTPVTWEELDRQMAWFHQPDANQFGGALFRNPGYIAWEWWVRFHAKGVWPLSPDMTPQLATDSGFQALEEMVKASAYLTENATTAGLFENWERYAKGDVYANIGWGGSQKFFNREDSLVRGKLAYGTTPGGMVDGQLLSTPYFNWGWNYVVMEGSENPELALLFCAFATSPEVSAIAVSQQDGFFDPFLKEHYENSQIVDAYSAEFLKVHRESLENAIPDLYIARSSEYSFTLSQWLKRALDGTVNIEDALRRTELEWNLITAEVGEAQQIERWNALQAKYPQAASTLLVNKTS